MTHPSPPKDFDALRSAILLSKANLPRRLTQVAAFALDHPDEMAFGTAASIAAAAAVQPSTLVRFARLYGYEGFTALQLIFRARLRARTSSYEERLRLIEGDGPAQVGVLDGFIGAAHRSLDALHDGIDAGDFGAAIALLAGAETIYLVAKRRSYPVSSYMAYAFGKLGIRCVLVGTASGIDDDILALAGPRDAALAISFAPYALETVAQARLLSDRGAGVVALTDSAFSPLVETARVWFEIAEADHAGFRSLSATMAFAMALTVGVAEARRHG